MKEIRFFIREEPYGFLSNFERTGFEAESWGKKYWYPTNEHYYQSQKANCQEVHDYILSAPHAVIAMVLGRQLEHNKYLKKYMKPDWVEKKDQVMLTGIRYKFSDKILARELLNTDNAILHENNPEDFYWGIGNGTGKSMLGKLEMRVRDEIQQCEVN